MQLTAQLENYLKALWSAEEWGRVATNGSLAQTLGLAPSSVTESVRKLVAAGLLEHQPYGRVTLTAAGRRIAAGVVRKHRLVETFLVEYLGYTWDEVHAEAEVLEHAVSDAFAERLFERLGAPERDPHGDPIPRADGTVPTGDELPLEAVPAGTRVRVVRVSDSAPGLLAELDAAGVRVGDELIVGERAFIEGIRVLPT